MGFSVIRDQHQQFSSVLTAVEMLELNAVFAALSGKVFSLLPFST